jgi:serine/threonine protein kinase
MSGRWGIRFLITRFWRAWVAGRGVVHRVEDPRLKRAVALKFLFEEFARDAQALERFQREQQARVRNESSEHLQVYDIGDEHGEAFIAMSPEMYSFTRSRVRRNLY